MIQRWVCKRCFTDNDGEAGACARCGLLRGSEVSDADRAAWASAAGVPNPMAAAERPAWRGLLRFWWIPAILIFLGIGWFTSAGRSDDGSLTSAGTVTVTDLRVGDCFDAEDDAEISDVDGIPCAEPHDYEVYVVQERDGASYPTEAEFDTIFDSLCVAAFESYVGSDYSTSALYAGMITPSEGSWDDGDREYICYLYEPVDTSLTENVPQTGSAEGSAR
jgi:hypothetical protein